MGVRRKPPALVKGLSHVGGQWPWSGSEAGVAGPGQHSPGGLGGAPGAERVARRRRGVEGPEECGETAREGKRPDEARPGSSGPRWPSPALPGLCGGVGRPPPSPEARPRPLGAALCGTGPEPLPGAFLAACRPPPPQQHPPRSPGHSLAPPPPEQGWREPCLAPGPEPEGWAAALASRPRPGQADIPEARPTGADR